jgi:hypothetical protein
MFYLYLPFRIDFSGNKIPFAFDTDGNGDRVAVTLPTVHAACGIIHDAWDNGDRDYTAGVIAVTRDADGWFVDIHDRIVCHESGEEPCEYDLVDDIRDAVWTVDGSPA